MSNQAPAETPSTKDRILEAAVELFGEKGFHGTSMRDVARKVGIKESSLYNHYEGKDGLLAAILDYHRQAFAASIPSDATMKALISSHNDAVELWMAAARILIGNIPPLLAAITRVLRNEMFLDARCRRFVLDSMFASQKEITRHLLGDMMERGLIRPCNLDIVVDQYVYFMQGMDMEQTLLLQEGADPQVLMDRMLELVAAYIADLAAPPGCHFPVDPQAAAN